MRGDYKDVEGEHPPKNANHFNRLLWYVKKLKFKLSNKYVPLLKKYDEENKYDEWGMLEYSMEGDEFQFNEFGRVVDDNIDILIECLENIDYYCADGPSDINIRNIYEGDISSLE